MSTENLEKYTVGFLTYERRRVLLIEKKRPDWQAGLWNGPGGKLKPGETPHECIVREFEEETTLHVPQWREYATWEGPGYYVWFFHAEWKLFEPSAERPFSPTDEQIAWHYISSLPTLPIIGNLRYLVPLAFDASVDCTHFKEGIPF